MSQGEGRRHGSLLRHHDFRLAWCAHAVSLTGTAVTRVALPLVAIDTLAASPFEVGVLAAMTWLPQLLLCLPAGVWVDRVRRRPTMVVADLGQALLVSLVPLAAWAGLLQLWLLYAVAATTGALSMLFGLGWAAYLPALIGRDRLVEGNSTLEATRTVVGIGGPGLGGLLVQAMTAPLALIADAASFVLSALGLARIRVTEPEPLPPDRAALAQLGQGFRFLVARPIAGVFVVFFTLAAVVVTAQQALLVIFLVRSVGLSPISIGTLLALSGVGGFVGALLTPRLSTLLGTGRAIWLAIGITFPFGLLIPLTRPGLGLASYVIGAGVLAAGIAATNIIAFSFLLTITPSDLLGRVASVARVLQNAGHVLGGLAGGALGGWLGVRHGLWVVMVALVAVAAFVTASPLRRIRDLPTYPE
ncbi:MFS transporter [Actinopolymorpha sp. B17G11]|uniref:MFS transporter n=1 Tax=unclassified Actinopolymorpha TaxID=2627063 RepID=UPI0032D99571